MLCSVCSQRPAQLGVLCEECREELSNASRMTPEQIVVHGATPTSGALIDVWGRPHRLEARTRIGRQIELGLAVLEPSVSRNHAELLFDELTGIWSLRDLGSANGTYHDDHLIEAATIVRTGDRLRFGQIGFYMIENADPLPQLTPTRTLTANMAPLSAKGSAAAINPLVDPNDATIHAPVVVLDDDDEVTSVGLPAVRIRLHEPTGGGGGLLEIDGKQVQLTTTQFELMALMIRRMATEDHQPDMVRGFVRSSELIADLSWDTREPNENHVKQLVRRVRRALIKSEIGDLIESRHRFGYRLRALPQLV